MSQQAIAKNKVVLTATSHYGARGCHGSQIDGFTRAEGFVCGYHDSKTIYGVLEMIGQIKIFVYGLQKMSLFPFAQVVVSGLLLHIYGFIGMGEVTVFL